jgi:hypothetical protein
LSLLRRAKWSWVKVLLLLLLRLLASAVFLVRIGTAYIGLLVKLQGLVGCVKVRGTVLNSKSLRDVFEFVSLHSL